MQDAIAGFESAPLWAQLAIVLFAVLVVVALVEPSVRKRRFRRQFDAIARGLGQEPPSSSQEWPLTFPTGVDDRAFEVRHDLRSSGGSYRGPRGYLLLTATRLAGTRWPMHQVDVLRRGRLAWLRGGQPTGDPEFDARFLVVEDGLPVREGWLDDATRKEIARFLDEAPRPGVLWIHEGELLFTMQEPWTGVDGPVVRTLLQRQAALASALERTAGSRS